MKLSHEIYDRTAVLTVTGEIQQDELDPIQRLVEELLEGPVRDFVIDMAAVETIDSKGLELLRWMQDQADEQMGQIRLASPNEHLLEVLRVTRLDTQFDAHEDIEAAVKSLR